MIAPLEPTRTSLTIVIGLVLAFAFFAQVGCNSDSPPTAKTVESPAPVSTTKVSSLKPNQFKPRLSDYGLFKEPMNELSPAADCFIYELNTPLFSDYSKKQRLVKLPPGTQARYRDKGVLEFPQGTIIAKTFYYHANANEPSSDRRLIETRILEHRSYGWVGVSYLWNEDQTEAELAIAGATVEVNWLHEDGEPKSINYNVPNLNDCKRCHTNEVMEPIGPKAGNLNRLVKLHGDEVNQLHHFRQTGLLQGLPELDSVARLATWNDESSGTLDERARAYLEVNCAHCHNPIGPARNSGLHLNIDEDEPYHLGVFKSPIAAGKGTGGRTYGIVPGKPDESIMEYRMWTVQPGEIMPEFGKSMVHEEGHRLIRDWIAAMK